MQWPAGRGPGGACCPKLSRRRRKRERGRDRDVCVCIYAHICIHTCICTIHIYIYMYMYVYMYLYTYLHTYMSVYTYMYICVYTCKPDTGPFHEPSIRPATHKVTFGQPRATAAGAQRADHRCRAEASAAPLPAGCRPQEATFGDVLKNLSMYAYIQTDIYM